MERFAQLLESLFSEEGVGGINIFKPIKSISICELLCSGDKMPCSHRQMNIERKKEIHLTSMGFWMSGNEDKFGRACFLLTVIFQRFIAFRKVAYNHLNIKHNI